MRQIYASTEILCEVCEAQAAKETSMRGEPVINRGEICVDLSGELIGTSRLSPLRPELAGLPKMRLCHDHLSRQRRQTGHEWVTLTEAAAMLARQDKRAMKNDEGQTQNEQVMHSDTVVRLRSTFVEGSGADVGVQDLLRRVLKKQ